MATAGGDAQERSVAVSGGAGRVLNTIEAIARVPDGPPARIRWRRVWHDIAAIEGPERISPEWWKHEEAALTRDYFRAEDSYGQRFWLYREGLYTTEIAAPRWFLHGLFG